MAAGGAEHHSNLLGIIPTWRRPQPGKKISPFPNYRPRPASCSICRTTPPACLTVGVVDKALNCAMTKRDRNNGVGAVPAPSKSSVPIPIDRIPGKLDMVWADLGWSLLYGNATLQKEVRNPSDLTEDWTKPWFISVGFIQKRTIYRTTAIVKVMPHSETITLLLKISNGLDVFGKYRTYQTASWYVRIVLESDFYWGETVSMSPFEIYELFKGRFLTWTAVFAF